MATKKPEASPKDDARKAEQDVLKASEKKADEREQAIKDAQAPDLAKGQQTGGTFDAVTKADVHVEPTRAAAIDPDSAPLPIVGGHDATQDKVGYAAKAELEVPAAVQDLDLPKFDEFVRKHEDAAQLQGAVVAEITHPDAGDGIYQGRDAGIRTKKGAASATYSDGSKH